MHSYGSAVIYRSSYHGIQHHCRLMIRQAPDAVRSTDTTEDAISNCLPVLQIQLVASLHMETVEACPCQMTSENQQQIVEEHLEPDKLVDLHNSTDWNVENDVMQQS